MTVWRHEAQDMIDAHAEGLHSPPEIPREGCPECEGRPLSDYPVKPGPDNAADWAIPHHSPHRR